MRSIAGLSRWQASGVGGWEGGGGVLTSSVKKQIFEADNQRRLVFDLRCRHTTWYLDLSRLGNRGSILTMGVKITRILLYV